MIFSTTKTWKAEIRKQSQISFPCALNPKTRITAKNPYGMKSHYVEYGMDQLLLLILWFP